MSNAKKVSDFLDKAKVFYFLTTDGDQPKGRPFSFHLLADDKLYFGCGTFKEVYTQLKQNPKIEILAMAGGEFLRYDGTMKEVYDESLLEKTREIMEQVAEAYLWADVVVFASPMYWGTITGQLKIVIDRLYAVQNRIGYADMSKQYKETAFLMTARGGYYKQALDFYGIFTGALGWKDWGTVLGAGKEAEAKSLGASIH